MNTAKYSPKYFRICKYGPYLAFLDDDDMSFGIFLDGGDGDGIVDPVALAAVAAANRAIAPGTLSSDAAQAIQL